MSLAHYAHHHNRAGPMATAAYPAYHGGDAIYGMHQYYPAGTSASPVEHDYSAGETSYVSDTSRAHWPAQPSSSASYPASVSTSDYPSPASSQPMSYPSAYTASPHRTGLQDPYAPSSSSSRTYASSSLSQASASSTPALPSMHRSSWPAGNAPASALYVVAPEPDADARPDAPYAKVKTEEEELESGFIFELASDAPPSLLTNPLLDSMPEVPLRATQASKEMRALMGAFRLDPFAMHNGVKSAASQSVPAGIEIGPLRVPPVMFEWQAELVQPLVPESPRWSPEAQPMHAFDDDEKWAHPGAMEAYGEAYDGADDMDAGAAFQPVMTPAQAVNWGAGFADQQGMVSAASSSPSGYPVQPLSGMFNRSGHSSSSQASISRSLPSLPQPQPSLFYRQTQNYALSSPTATLPSPSALPSPSLSHSLYSQRSTPGSATDMYYRQQQHQHTQPLPSAAAASAMRMSSSSISAPVPSLSRRPQLDYAQTHSSAVAQPQPHYASPSPPAFSSNSSSDGGAGMAAGPGRYRDDTLGWYRRSAFALEAYTAAACT
ncbi:uncharacterized protein B0H18DRAFT_1115191 [Fomitopsis serialis]|uniref:uncharacterized protein n=1 Tax=Fomitopsis serialis TaxID=139415 RepID=UPI0020084595|nr:uncharacterized protein B0H18DRAFT_1115191 [Neoantrodia serialis]KAH9933824.1 hypothetical protein B0H18DRAFT_1115191 [Neoantrodia serialis]